MKPIIASAGLALCCLSACQPVSVLQTTPKSAAGAIPGTGPAEMELTHQGHTLSERDMPEFLIQNFQRSDNSNFLANITKLAKEWYGKPRNPDSKRKPELLISDVLLTDSRTSILGKGATGAITPDYGGKLIGLTLKGTFKDNGKPLQIKSFRFTLEPSLVQQTFVDTDPKSRVLLDDSILMEPISVSGTEIRVRLNTQGAPDLYLKGLHKITVEQDNWYTDSLVQVGDPTPVKSLQPRIDSVELMPDDRGKPQNLLLHGANFMVFPKLSYATVDGAFGFGYQTEVSDDGSADTVIHLPDPKSFKPNARHTVVYSTIFGIAFKEF